MNNISITIIICTYKREQYVLKNIDILSKYCKDVIKEVYVIDNGQTLPSSLNNDFIHIVPNKNLGGSGGYARGMYEVHKHSNCSHIMLMDDDIEFTPEVLHKAYKKLCNFTEEEKDDWIGFGMVSFDKPDELYECGAYWNGLRAKRNNHGLNINSNKSLNSKLKYNYSAWWSIIMPISVIEKYGYPYPFFIKFDDTEYGLRRKGEKIHFYKDLFVKHESFNNKYNCLVDYYGLRNALITNTVHNYKFLKNILYKYIINVFKRCLSLNFSGVKSANYGLYCYLKGPEIFLKKDIEEYNAKIRDLIGKKIFFIIDAVYLPFVIFKNIFLILIKYKSLKKRYIKAYSSLISEKYWNNQFSNI